LDYYFLKIDNRFLVRANHFNNFDVFLVSYTKKVCWNHLENHM